MMIQSAKYLIWWFCIPVVSSCSFGMVSKNVPRDQRNYIAAKQKPVEAKDLKSNFYEALKLLQRGNETVARELLEQVSMASSPLPGITEEALFRLALLRLRDGGEPGAAGSQALLERLAHEYPDGIWAKQAAPFADYLATTQKQYSQLRQLSKLRERNLSLSRDNESLRLKLEKLKSLDMELEKKLVR